MGRQVMAALAAIALWAVSGASAPALAEDAPAPTSQAPSSRLSPMIMVDDEDSVIYGEQQGPEVSLFLTPQNLDKVQDLDLEESLLPRIVEAVDRTPL